MCLTNARQLFYNIFQEVHTMDNKSEFDTLVEFVSESGEQATEQIILCLRELAKAVLENAAKGADMVVPPEHEERKRNTIRDWRLAAERFEEMIDLCHLGKRTMADAEVCDEVNDMLQRGLGLFLIANPATSLELERGLRVLMIERARNIAQAYQGRVLREGK